MLEDFVIRALVGGLILAVISGPLGSLLVWRRMSYFGDTLAHSSLLGMGLSLFFNIHPYMGLVALMLAVAGLLTFLSHNKKLASDAILGMLAHTTLALGLIFASHLPGGRLDLLSYLYGDILAISQHDILWILCVALIVLAALAILWRSLLAITLDEALAQVEGVKILRTKAIFMVLLALVFAVAMKLVGVLLTTALLIIPPTAARSFAKTPEQMALIASLMGMLAVTAGIAASHYCDWPTGPAIVVSAAGIFVLSLILKPS